MIVKPNMFIPTTFAALKHHFRNRRLDQRRALYVQFFLIGIFAWVMVGCNASLHFNLTPPPSPNPTIVATSESGPETTITFKVQIPLDTPPDQQMVISLLDEVTGLALNVQRYEMQEIDDQHYKVELTLPVGAIIKYRYGRQDAYLVEEHTSIEKPVRYRLYRVDGPGMIEDVISAWSDTSFSGSSGRIMGLVSDSITGRPVPNLMVTAGGTQVLTASDGSFLIEALPPGIHNLVVYAMDGAYRTFQQGAKVASESTTLSEIQVVPAPQIPVTFKVKIPENTFPSIPLRLAGNLSQLGNTFADLTGGTNAIASRMPVISPDSNGQYQLTINLPAGADVAYKYTLGDGLWNAEYNGTGDFRLRSLIVPEAPVIVQDQVDTWGTEYFPGPVIFEVTVPATTPHTDQVSIQFNPFGWTEPIPMWQLEDQRWAFMLYNPVQSSGILSYRYCRNDQCGSADDGLTPGPQNPGRTIEIGEDNQPIHDTTESWNWLADETRIPLKSTEVSARKKGFIAGVEFQPDYHPSWIAQLSNTLTDIQALQGNWLIVTPSWTFTHSSPVVLEPVQGTDPTWQDTTRTIAQAQSLGLQTAVFPIPHFPDGEAEWWASAPRDFAWWLVWFERYRSFLLHHADLAQSSDAQALILGGEWVTPALPGGMLVDGNPSNVLADAESRWEGLLVELRDRFNGDLIWAMPASLDGLSEYPPFISSYDKIYLLWSLPLTSGENMDPAQLSQAAQTYLDTNILPLKDTLGKPIILGVSYPSAAGGISGCVPNPETEEQTDCLDLDRLSRPEPDIPDVILDVEEQYLAYETVFEAINTRDWISGVISRGYYPPAELQDKSTSIHGKPVEDLLNYWYPLWIKSSIAE